MHSLPDERVYLFKWLKKMRINNLARFFHKDKEIIIKTYTWETVITYSAEVYDFIVHIFLTHQIPSVYYPRKDSILKLLHQINFILPDECWNYPLESLESHAFWNNPTLTYQELSVEEMNYIYNNIWNTLSNAINLSDFNEINVNPVIYNASTRHNSHWKSVRFSFWEENSSKFLAEEYTALLMSIFKKNNEWHQRYGSGGWLYSVFPILILKDSSVALYDIHNQKIYTTHIEWSYDNIVSSILPQDNDFSQYNAYILLCSNPEFVFKKYGNRGYRYILMESGAIGSITRNDAIQFQKWYLEIQWFLDHKIWSIITNCRYQNHDIFILHLIGLT